jgi:hypothetical protein
MLNRERAGLVVADEEERATALAGAVAGDDGATLAVAVITMVTGRGPQENAITPPAATAWTTACDVQLPGVPWPTT